MSRVPPFRIVLLASSLTAALLGSFDLARAADNAGFRSIRVYVGGRGIQTFELDPNTGKPTEPQVAGQARGVGFLTISPSHKFLYATTGIPEYVGHDRGKYRGAVAAYSIDAKSGALTHLNTRPSEGDSTAHVAVDHSERNVLVVNYDRGAAIVCFPIKADGSLAPRSSLAYHTGSSVNPSRQRGPHPHSVNLSPDDRFAIVADLGADKVFVYRFDSEQGSLELNDPPSVAAEPGSGPRHFCFHPSGTFAYQNNELGATVTAYAFDARRGVLTPLNTLSTLPDDAVGAERSTAETLVHPSGKFVYVSNRGHDSIAIFRVNDDGSLSGVGYESTRGKIPRSFGIDPTGKFLLAANQDSDTVVIFRIDQETGALHPTGDVLSIPSPQCVRMFGVE